MPMNPTNTQRLFAFWKYDTFPYLLGAEVLEIKDNGRVVAKGYPGYSFKPIVVLPYEAGVERQANIKAIESAYNLEIEQINERFDQRIQQLFEED